jgi:deferrochelatase/peroxidase EfeB
VLQFIADTALAVNRAVVETWKALHDLTAGQSEKLPLLPTRFYTGFQRDDSRSWIDFHDGISNLRSADRLAAIAIKETGDASERWTVGGTYLAYLRVAVDLAIWRKLAPEKQELMVGRDKLTGCPLTTLDAHGRGHPAPGCPVAGSHDIVEKTDAGNAEFREPASVADPVLQASHVQRANHHTAVPGDRNSLRVFRQGYEFLEAIDQAPGFRAGLNFVSFQDTPERLFRVLTQDGWLGRVNFGGDPDHPLPGMDRFLTVRAGAIFLVPPAAAGESFPGSGAFPA